MFKNWQSIIKLTFILTVSNFCQGLFISAQADDNYFPDKGTIVEMVAGDLMCYITVKNNHGKTDIVGATFEFCENQEKYINEIVNFSYSMETVNDCQSSEPCGKTRKVKMITDIEIVD